MHTRLCYLWLIHAPSTTIHTLSLHDALPIYQLAPLVKETGGHAIHGAGHSRAAVPAAGWAASRRPRSEEHTSELQSQSNLVCRPLLEKKKRDAAEARQRTSRKSSHRKRSDAV